MQMLGVRNQRQKREQREGVRPPQRLHRAARPSHKKRRQVRCHQREDQQRNQPGLPGNLAQPFGPHQESPHKQAENADRAGDGEDGRKIKVQSPYAPCGIEKANAENRRAVVQRNQREGAERPEHQRMRHARKRPLANHLRLQQHLPDKVAHALADREEMKVRVFLRLENLSEDGPEAPPESVDRRCRQRDEQPSLPERKVPGLGQELAAGPS